MLAHLHVLARNEVASGGWRLVTAMAEVDRGAKEGGKVHRGRGLKPGAIPRSHTIFPT